MVIIIPWVIIVDLFITIIMHLFDHVIFIYCFFPGLVRQDLQSTFVLTCLLLYFSPVVESDFDPEDYK
jgi:hypothetical protein